MAFTDYESEEKRRRGLLLGAAAGIGIALAVPDVRQALVRTALSVGQRLGARAIPQPRALPIQNAAREVESFLHRTLPRQARSAVGAVQGRQYFEQALRGHGPEVAAREAERFSQLPSVRRFLVSNQRAPETLFREREVLTALQQHREAIGFRGPQTRLQSNLTEMFSEARKRVSSEIDVKGTEMFRAADAHARDLIAEEAERLANWQGTPFGRALHGMGLQPATVGDVRSGRINHNRFPGLDEAIQSLEKERGLLSRETLHGLPLGNVFRTVDGAEGPFQVYDLSRLQHSAQNAQNWMKEHFQIPLAPGAMGISPLQLFPWMQGNLKLQLTHIGPQAKDPALKAFLGSQGDELGWDVFKVGERWFGADFAAAGAEEGLKDLPLRGDAWTGMYGFRARRARALNAAAEAKARIEAGDELDWKQQTGLLGGQYGESTGDRIKSVFQKFDENSNWGPRIFQRVLGQDIEEVQADDVRRAIGILTSGKLSPELRQSLREEVGSRGLYNALFDNPDSAARALAGLEKEEGVRAFLEAASQNQDFNIRSRPLRELVNQYSSNPESFWRRLEVAPNRSVFGYNFLGTPDDLHAIPLARRAIYDDLEERIAGGLGIPDAGEGETHFLDWLSGQRDFNGAAKIEAEAFAHGKNMQRRLHSNDPAGPWNNPFGHAAAYLRESEAGQVAAEAYIQKTARAWHAFPQPDDSEFLQTARLFSARGTLSTFNSAIAGGSSWGEAFQQAYGVQVNSVKGFFTGKQEQITDTTLAMEYFPRRLNEIMAEVGLGLPAQDLESGWSVTKGLFLKRILPAYAGYELYRYADYKADEAGVDGPSDYYANLKSRAGLARARHLGTSILGIDRGLLPGLEKFIPVRDEQEEWQHQQNGYDPVKRGRYWFLGSRGEFWGDKTSYYAPGSVQVARSNWQGAENVDQNTKDYWRHSYIPLPENNFLGPLGDALTDPYWFEKKHSRGPNADRPYLQTGPRFDPSTPSGPLLNALLGWTKPTINLHPEYLPQNMGGTASREDLRAINEQLKAGGEPQGIRSILGAGGDGTGGGTGGGGSGRGGGYGDPDLSSPGAITARQQGVIGSIAEVTPGGQLRLKHLPTGISKEEFAELGNRGRQFGGGSTLSRKEISQLNEMTKAGGGGMFAVRGNSAQRMLKDEPPYSEEQLQKISRENQYLTATRNMMDVTGLYGFMAEQAWKPDQDGLIIPTATDANAFGVRFYQQEIGGLGGGLSEFGRRFIPKAARRELWNPVPNSSMPSWLPGGSEYFIDFATGDPLTKIPKAALRLPGEAYERVHPGVKLMQTRASAIGGTTEEIMRGMLHLDEEMSGYGNYVTEKGDEIHAAFQRAWKKAGVLIAAEDRIYDEELGISGHFDAILNTPGGPVVGEIKTTSTKRFEEAIKKGGLAEHRTQLNFYLHELGINTGVLFYVNRDTGQIVTVERHYDPGLFRQTVEKVQTARNRLESMVDRGLISRGELYSPVDRYEILGDVALYSDNFMSMKAYIQKQRKDGNLSPEEEARVDAVDARVRQVKKKTTLYPYQFKDVKVEGHHYRVEQILDSMTLRVAGQEEPLRLAGVEKPSEARIEAAYGPTPEGMTPAEWFWQNQGITPGVGIEARIDADKLRRIGQDVRKSIKAVVFTSKGNLNQRLIQTGVLEENPSDESSPGIVARFSPNDIRKGAAWETFAHQDNFFNNKFLRVRSPLEQLERGIVYGKDNGGWQTAFRDYVVPSLESYASRDPLLAALGAGTFATFFFRTRSMKAKAAAVGAGVGVLLSVNRLLQESSGELWKPSRVRKREELEEYWDILKYVKARGLAASEEKLAREKEGTDVDHMVRDHYAYGNAHRKKRLALEDRKTKLMRKGVDRNDPELKQINEQLSRLAKNDRTLKLGPHATRAILYRQQFRATLYGADPDVTPYAEIMRALPKYKREVLTRAIETSNTEERRRIYRLLPDAEQRVLGKYLGASKGQRPSRPELRDYFRKHPLPDSNWEGWSPAVDLEELRTRAIDYEGLDPMESGIFPMQVEEANRTTRGIAVPTLHGPGPADLQYSLNKLLSGKGLKNVIVRVDAIDHDGPEHDVQVDMKLRHRKEQEIKRELGLL